VCALTYGALGMPAFDALMHALTTISTGGFSSRDASFGVYQGPLEYVAAVFMILASLPFVRYIQLVAGTRARSCATARCAPISSPSSR
jgi:trk system potassium uptake protein TrkH